jgi:hypothetical protein
MCANYDWGLHESSLVKYGKAISFGICMKNNIECLKKKCALIEFEVLFSFLWYSFYTQCGVAFWIWCNGVECKTSLKPFFKIIDVYGEGL